MHSVLHKANVERSARLKQQTLQQQQQQQYQLQLQQQQYNMQQEHCKIFFFKFTRDRFKYLKFTVASIYFTFYKETAYE